MKCLITSYNRKTRKLRNIRPSGAFSPEVMSLNVTRMASLEVPLVYSLGLPRPIIVF